MMMMITKGVMTLMKMVMLTTIMMLMVAAETMMMLIMTIRVVRKYDVGIIMMIDLVGKL